ncbi:MAG: pyridoxal-phosphate dependent enzyme [Solirubrobacterales bacterium]
MQSLQRQSAQINVDEIEKRLPMPLLSERRAQLSSLVRHTPILHSPALSELAGTTVLLKAENLQRTGSFKIRGALAKLRQLASRSVRRVATGTAGNHGQSVAFAARAMGLKARLYMPANAPLSKIEAVQALGGEVVLGGESVDQCIGRARRYAEESGAAFVHPFDDYDVLSGQATLGLELLDDVPDMAQVVIPVGGGGLAGAVGMTLNRIKQRVRVIGVQAQVCAPFVLGHSSATSDTLADGIAIKRPGQLTSPLVDRYVDEIKAVSEGHIAEAMTMMLERAKLVVEGAGAVGVAAWLSGVISPASGPTVIVLSGGNVDLGTLSSVTRRQETLRGRRMRLLTRVPDRPGGLANLLRTVADANANLISVEHLRDAVHIDVGETGLELVLGVRNPEHSEAVIAALRQAGYATDPPISQ